MQVLLGNENDCVDLVRFVLPLAFGMDMNAPPRSADLCHWCN